MQSTFGYQHFQTRCACGAKTNRKYAREHGGRCKGCVTGVSAAEQASSRPTRDERILEHGYAAYAREEGHYGD